MNKKLLRTLSSCLNIILILGYLFLPLIVKHYELSKLWYLPANILFTIGVLIFAYLYDKKNNSND